MREGEGETGEAEVEKGYDYGWLYENNLLKCFIRKPSFLRADSKWVGGQQLSKGAFNQLQTSTDPSRPRILKI